MWPWRKKDKPKQAPEPREPIVYRADDVPLVRAEKIWMSLGFGGDRFGSIPAIAGYLAMYREWDREAAEAGVKYLGAVEPPADQDTAGQQKPATLETEFDPRNPNTPRPFPVD